MKAATAQKAVGDLGNVLAPSDLRQEYFQRARTDTKNLVSVVYGAGKVVAAVARTSRSYNQHWGDHLLSQSKNRHWTVRKFFRKPLVWRRACLMTTSSRPPLEERTAPQRIVMLRTSDKHSWKRRNWTWSWVLGPFTSEQAAKVCGCGVSELCPGRMAAKVRTIYDGSSGGVLVLSGQNGQSVEN